MCELEFLPPWYMQLRRERRLLKQTIAGAVVIIVLTASLQIGAWWMLRQQRDRLHVLNQQSARLAAAEVRQQKLGHERDRLQAEYTGWTHAGSSVSAVALSRTLATLMPAHVTLTSMAIDGSSPGSGGAWGVVELWGVAGSDVDIAAMLLSLNRHHSFNHVTLGAVSDQRLEGDSLRGFDVSFVAAADSSEELP